jgi:SAM-dependent methyltransferase
MIPTPVEKRCDFWDEQAAWHGVLPGSSVLAAGCGTGSYAVELARRGCAVTAIDASPELIAVAREKIKKHNLPVDYRVGDILKLPATPKFDAILCRGVLNDMIDDGDRQAAFDAFARALRRDGMLMLDVREWFATAHRKSDNPIFEKTVKTDAGTLVFQSVSCLDHKKRQLFVTEGHSFGQGNVSVVTEYKFVMRCWTKGELCTGLDRAGFTADLFGGYDQTKLVGSTDRIVAVSALVC